MQRATLPTSHQLVILKPFRLSMIFLNVSPKIKKWSITQDTLQANSLCSARLKKKECTYSRFSYRANDVCPTGLKESSGSSTSHRQKYLGNTKIKTRVWLCRPFRSPLFFIFSVAIYLIKRWGVWNFLEPSKIRFKGVSFFYDKSTAKH